MSSTKTSFIILAVAVLAVGYLLIKPNGLTSTAHAELLAAYNAIPTASGKAAFMEQSANLTKRVDPALVDLDSQIISCSPSVDTLLQTNPVAPGSCIGGDTALATTTGKYLSGQCCGAMKDLAAYREELQKLQKYRDIPDVPMNPYKTPIELAKKWIDYDKTTALAPNEQMILDQAMKLSKEGPCCCKCWHYYVNEGVAKKMIRNYGYTARQIAEYWDASSIC